VEDLEDIERLAMESLSDDIVRGVHACAGHDNAAQDMLGATFRKPPLMDGQARRGIAFVPIYANDFIVSERAFSCINCNARDPSDQ
jgi:hypothetical protein